MKDKEQTISNLRKLKSFHNGSYGADIDRAIKALQQESVLDKIRAEIMQLEYDEETVDYDHNDMPQTEIIHTICREEVLRIIDKYRAYKEE